MRLERSRFSRTCMAFDKAIIGQCFSLGGDLRQRLTLGLLGLLMPARDRSRNRWWRIYARTIPCLWIQPKQLNGMKLLVDPTDWSQTLIVQEILLHNNYDLDKVNFQPEVVFDCGAHIGIFSLLAKNRFPRARITAFEPHPQNARIVRKQISANHLDINLVESAVSTETKRLGFVWRNSHNGRLLHGEANAFAAEVSVVNFLEVVKESRAASLLLKMDIEGEERNVLPMLVPLLPRQSALFFETHSGEAGWKEIEALLVSNGFVVEQLNERGQYYDGFACRGEAVGA